MDTNRLSKIAVVSLNLYLFLLSFWPEPYCLEYQCPPFHFAKTEMKREREKKGEQKGREKEREWVRSHEVLEGNRGMWFSGLFVIILVPISTEIYYGFIWGERSRKGKYWESVCTYHVLMLCLNLQNILGPFT